MYIELHTRRDDDNRHRDPTQLRKGFYGSTTPARSMHDELIKPKLHDSFTNTMRTQSAATIFQ
jgi:hypothetical protein